MKKLLLAALLIAILPLSSSGDAFTTKIQRSIVHINYQVEQGVAWCSGFVVGVNRVITAAHCLPDPNGDFPLIVEDLPARTVRQDASFALIEVLGPLNKPSLPLRESEANVGEPVITFGYGYGSMKVLYRHVAERDGEDVIIDGPIVHGMSGGPLVDALGQVVGLNQATVPELGKACGVKEIKKFLGMK